MTVTISSTTDTEAEVRAAVQKTATETDAPPSPPVEDAVEASAEESSPEDSAPEAEASVEAAGELVAEEDEAEWTDPESKEEVSEPASGADTDPPLETAPDEPVKKKRRRRGRSYKERASQLAREKATESARADALAAQLANVEARQSVPRPQADPMPAPEAAPLEGSRPDQTKFETFEEYQEALVDWKVSQRLEAHEQDRAVRIESENKRRRQQDVVAAHVARIDTFRDENPDFDAVVEQAKDLPVTAPMHDAVMNSESGPAVMYHLCQNPEECDRIAQMAPLAAIKEIGRLEAQLDVARPTGPTPKAEPVTKAPRPIKPVGGGVTASTVPLDQMNFQDYKRARERQIAAAAGLPDPYAGVRR